MSKQNSVEPSSKTRERYFSFRRTPTPITELDGLRALAILFVLARHAFHPIHQKQPELFLIGDWNLAPVLVNGWIGVDLFFVLSGFLITRHLIKKNAKGQKINIRNYFRARALRIIPTYFFVLAIVVLGLLPFYEINQDRLFQRIVYHMLFLQDYFPSDIVVAFWSLGVEEKFYLVAPLLALLSNRLQSPLGRYAFLISLLLLPLVFRAIALTDQHGVITYTQFFRVFRSPFHMTLDGLIVGVICAHLNADKSKIHLLNHPNFIRLMFWIGTLCILSHLVPVIMLENITPYDMTIQSLIIPIAFGAILLSVILDENAHPILNSQAALVIARISYPLYLVHMLFVNIAFSKFLTTQEDSLLGLIGPTISYLGGAMAMAFIIHFLIEKPFMRLKERYQRTEV